MGGFIICSLNFCWALVPSTHLVSPRLQGQSTPPQPLGERYEDRRPQGRQTLSETSVPGMRAHREAGIYGGAGTERSLGRHTWAASKAAHCTRVA